jgi:polysaccharide transporter, PST family
MPRFIDLFRLSRNLRQVLSHPVTRNTISLYIIQFVNIVLPLLLVPYLARVLLPDIFGVYLFFYSLSIWIYTAIEYGFTLSATREISSVRDDAGRTALIVSEVIGGQSLLAISVLLLGIGSFYLSSFLRDNFTFFAVSLLFGVFRGMGPLWYFQGRETISAVAAVEVAGRLGGTLLTFLLVRVPSQGWLALALSGLASVLVTLIQIGLMYREIGFIFPTLRDSLAGLKNNASIFIYRIAGSLYTTANVVIVGVLSPPAIVSFYGGAEKIIRGLLTLIYPLISALYPRLTYLVIYDTAKAWRALNLTLVAFMIVGVVLCGIVAVWAPLWIFILLGPGYETAVPLLRVLSLEALVLPLSTVVSILYMLPLKMDRILNSIILGAGLLNVFLAVILLHVWGALGMAVTAVFTETFVAACTLLILFKVKMPVGGEYQSYK